jgi:hypothetical protein
VKSPMGVGRSPQSAAEWQDDPAAAADEESFTVCLNRHLRRSSLSLTALARRSWLDVSYVSRLVNLPCDPLNARVGDRTDRRHPSRDTVIRLGLAMQLSMEEMDQLILAAGYAPLVR